jgi:hypothetical protein
MLRWWTFSKEYVLILQDFRVLVQGGFLVLSCSTLGWVYIRNQVQETWGLKHPSMNLTSALEIGPPSVKIVSSN